MKNKTDIAKVLQKAYGEEFPEDSQERKAALKQAQDIIALVEKKRWAVAESMISAPEPRILSDIVTGIGRLNDPNPDLSDDKSFFEYVLKGEYREPSGLVTGAEFRVRKVLSKGWANYLIDGVEQVLRNGPMNVTASLLLEGHIHEIHASYGMLDANVGCVSHGLYALTAYNKRDASARDAGQLFGWSKTDLEDPKRNYAAHKIGNFLCKRVIENLFLAIDESHVDWKKVQESRYVDSLLRLTEEE